MIEKLEKEGSAGSVVEGRDWSGHWGQGLKLSGWSQRREKQGTNVTEKLTAMVDQTRGPQGMLAH